MSQNLLLDDSDEFYPKHEMWGDPAIGKTATIRELSHRVIEIRLSAIDIADIRGLPTVPHEGE